MERFENKAQLLWRWSLLGNPSRTLIEELAKSWKENLERKKKFKSGAGCLNEPPVRFATNAGGFCHEAPRAHMTLWQQDSTVISPVIDISGS
jgi:hypothetical protein